MICGKRKSKSVEPYLQLGKLAIMIGKAKINSFVIILYSLLLLPNLVTKTILFYDIGLALWITSLLPV